MGERCWKCEDAGMSVERWREIGLVPGLVRLFVDIMGLIQLNLKLRGGSEGDEHVQRSLNSDSSPSSASILMEAAKSWYLRCLDGSWR